MEFRACNSTGPNFRLYLCDRCWQPAPDLIALDLHLASPDHPCAEVSRSEAEVHAYLELCHNCSSAEYSSLWYLLSDEQRLAWRGTALGCSQLLRKILTEQLTEAERQIWYLDFCVRRPPFPKQGVLK